MIKLLALDIDGTVMGHDFNISSPVKSAIAKAIQKGVKVLIATGRMYCATTDVARELKIQTPLLTYQGALVKDLAGEVFHHLYLEEIGARKIVDELRKMDIQINSYLNDKLIVETENPSLIDYAGKRHIGYEKVKSFDDIENFEPTKLLAIDNDTEKVTRVKDYLVTHYAEEFYITKSTPYFCEIAHKKVSKGNSITKLATEWGIEKSQIMAIGDQENDIEMFHHAGLSVAMGNAPDNVKKFAKTSTAHVNDDGVARAIEKHVL